MPGRSRPYPDLDLIAAVSGAAMFWLFLGDYTGQNALNAYNLGFRRRRPRCSSPCCRAGSRSLP